MARYATNIFELYAAFFKEQIGLVDSVETLTKVNHEVLSYIFYVEDYERIEKLYEGMKSYNLPKNFMLLFAMDALAAKRMDGMEYGFDTIDFLETKYSITIQALKDVCLKDVKTYQKVFEDEPNALGLLVDYCLIKKLNLENKVIIEAKDEEKTQHLDALSAVVKDLIGLEFTHDVLDKALSVVKLERAI